MEPKCTASIFPRLLPALLVASLLSSCSLGFHRDWRAAAAKDATSKPSGLEGAWEGTWKSEPTGHHGTLKAIVSQSSPEKDGVATYQFRYFATWAKVLSGTMEAEHSAKRAKTGWTLSGSKDLGMLGGVYSFTGTATPETFEAQYQSKMDHGVFEMKRPSPGNGQ